MDQLSILLLFKQGFSIILDNVLLESSECLFKLLLRFTKLFLKLHLLLERKSIPFDVTIILSWASLHSKRKWLTCVFKLNEAVTHSGNVAVLVWWEVVDISFEFLNHWFHDCFLTLSNLKNSPNPCLFHSLCVILKHWLLMNRSIFTFKCLKRLFNFLIVNCNFNRCSNSTNGHQGT